MLNINRNRIKHILVFIVTIILFPVLLVIYYFDPAKISFFGSCPIYAKTGLLCPSCGMTRALHNLLHLRFEQAWNFNPLIYILLLIFMALIYKYVSQICYTKNSTQSCIKSHTESQTNTESQINTQPGKTHPNNIPGNKTTEITLITLILLIIVIYTIWRNINI